MTPERVLQDVFGLPAFRPHQAEVVEAQLRDRDVLSVAPTGSGKSISYWIPALLGEGCTVVVSPLIALMKDQVDRLREHGVAATFVNSTIERREQWQRLQETRAGRVRILYLAPERFGRPGFLQVLHDLRVTRFVVDEAHCISTWGHDFRPDYRLLGQAIEACGRPPIAAFTATATPEVREDIVSSLALRDPFVSVTGFHRPNLHLAAQRCRNDDEKREVLRRRLAREPGRVLIYCATVRATNELATEVREWGIPAAAYHAQLEEGARRRVQEGFQGGSVRVVVATVAFGMGVDIPDIRQVIHFHLPGSLESYYQEAGRAGRDGEPATCLLLWRPGDRDIQSFLMDRTFEESDRGEGAQQRRRHGYARLGQIETYARLRTCRHARIADYFGESGVARTCDACDNCLAGDRPAEEEVDPRRARAALAAVRRFNGKLGAGNVAAILVAADIRWIREHRWVTDTDVYGVLKGWTQDRVRALLQELVDRGLARPSPGEYPTLQLTPEGGRVLEEKLDPRVRLPAASGAAHSTNGTGPQALDSELGRRLRAWRTEKARSLGVPAYVVLHDRTLAALSAGRPADRTGLLAVPGMGLAKVEKYGDELLQVLTAPS